MWIVVCASCDCACVPFKIFNPGGNHFLLLFTAFSPSPPSPLSKVLRPLPKMVSHSFSSAAHKLAAAASWTKFFFFESASCVSIVFHWSGSFGGTRQTPRKKRSSARIIEKWKGADMHYMLGFFSFSLFEEMKNKARAWSPWTAGSAGQADINYRKIEGGTKLIFFSRRMKNLRETKAEGHLRLRSTSRTEIGFTCTWFRYATKEGYASYLAHKAPRSRTQSNRRRRKTMLTPISEAITPAFFFLEKWASEFLIPLLERLVPTSL